MQTSSSPSSTFRQEAVFRTTLVGRGITAGSRPSRVFLKKIKGLEPCKQVQVQVRRFVRKQFSEEPWWGVASLQAAAQAGSF